MLIRRKKPILARAINYMFPYPLWTPSSLQYHLPYITAAALAHPTLNTPRIDYSPSFRRVCIVDGSVFSLIRLVALECMPYNPNAIPWTFFLCWPIASNSSAETHLLEHGLVCCSNHKMQGRTQKFLKGVGVQFFKNEPVPNCGWFILTINENACYYSQTGFHSSSCILLQHLLI